VTGQLTATPISFGYFRMTALLPREPLTFLPHFVSPKPEVQFFRDCMATLGVGDQVGETLPVFQICASR
jgi:hypothetical protein